MKRSFSLGRWLHNDKFVMILSLVLAIVLWAIVVYGPGNSQDRVITGVPVSITLNDYAGQTLNLRITEGSDATATVRVHGLRSVISRLSAADIMVTADTGNVIKEGSYTLPLRAVANGDYTIESVVGPDGNGATVTVSCAVWREITVSLMAEMNGLSVTDSKQYRFGTPSFSGDAVSDGMITVSGARADISRVASVKAVITEERSIDETTVFSASLEARDETDAVVKGVTFNGVEDNTVLVTIPVMEYREVALTPTVTHAPTGYADTKDLVTVSPTVVKLWGVPTALEDYIDSLQKQIEVDFDHLDDSGLKREILLEQTDGIRPVNGNELVSLTVHLSGIQKKTLEIPITEQNLSFENADGVTARAIQSKVSVTVCGPASAVRSLTASQIQLIADMTGTTGSGQQTVPVRATVNNPRMWAYYGSENSSVDLLVELMPVG